MNKAYLIYLKHFPWLHHLKQIFKDQFVHFVYKSNTQKKYTFFILY